jgi:hypothetical protein
LNSKEVWNEFEKQLSQESGSQDRDKAQERIKKIDATISRIVDAVDEANLALLNEKLTKLREEKAMLQTQLAATKSTNVATEEYKERAKAYLKRVSEVMAQGTPEERKELVRDFVDRVEIDSANKKGRLFYRAPFFVLTRKSSIQNGAGEPFRSEYTTHTFVEVRLKGSGKIPTGNKVKPSIAFKYRNSVFSRTLCGKQVRHITGQGSNFHGFFVIGVA